MNVSANPKYHILVVDDDVDLNTTFALLLEFDGHEVRTAHTAEATLALLEKSKFDLIIAEYWLPGIKGDELASLVKHKWPDQPIILTTANIEVISKAPPIPAVDCLLNKPFSISQLREAITWTLDLSAGNQQGAPTHSLLSFGHLGKSDDTGRTPTVRSAG